MPKSSNAVIAALVLLCLGLGMLTIHMWVSAAFVIFTALYLTFVGFSV